MRERRPGVWQLRVYAGAGRWVTETHHGTEAAATVELTKLWVRVQEAEHQYDPGTFGELVQKRLAFRAPHLSPSTIRGYTGVVDVHILPALGRIRLADLRAHHLDGLYTELLTRKDRPLRPATIRQVHAVIRASLQQGVKWGMVPTNVAMQATPPAVRRGDVRPPAPADVRRAIAALEERPALATAIRLAATTGVRRGELVALRWSDFHLEGDEPTVTVTRAAVVGLHQQVTMKGTKTDRVKVLALDPGTAARVRTYREHQAAEAARNGVEPVGDPYLFPAELDGSAPWHPNRLTALWRSVAAANGLDGVRLHDLRHFMITELLAAGVDVRTVAGRAGHSNPSMTLNVYGHFIPGRDRGAAGEIGDLLD